MPTMRRVSILTLCVLASLLPARSVAAQPLAIVGMGVVDLDHFTLGGTLGIPLGAPTGPWLLGIGGAVEAPDDLEQLDSWTYWEGNVDLIARSTNASRLRVFALAGFHFARAARDCPLLGCPMSGSEWDTSTGMNLGAGFALVWESFAPLVGVKAELKDGTPFAFFAGLALPFPGYE